MELLEKRSDTPENAHMQHQLEASYKNLERVLGSVQMADNKALIALTFQGAILAGLALIAGYLKDAFHHQSTQVVVVLLVLVLLGFFGCFGAATLKLFRTISPRMATSAHDEDHPAFLFFFGGIARMPPDTFANRMHAITPNEIHDGLLTVTHNNARIATEKFANLRVAYRVLGLELGFFVFIVLLSVLPTQA